MWGEHYMYGGFMWIFWIIVLVVLVLLVKWIFEQSRSGSSDTKEKESPLEILKKRYARGEINQEEYEQKKKDLLE